MRLRGIVALALFGALAGSLPGQIRTNAGFRQKSVPGNDDGSAPLEPLGWTANFFGRFRSVVFVNNNGNITFDAPLPTFTPFGLTNTGREIIAPFFADVDTRPQGSALVTYGHDTIDGRRAFAANYVSVGYYDRHVDKLNSFQVVLIQRQDTGEGNFDIEFNYEQIQWETGDASEGVNGFGGTSAAVGWSNGSGQPGTFFELAGSRIPGSFLSGGANSLVRGRTPGVNSRAGRWGFRARGGTIIPALSITSGCPAPNATAGRAYRHTFAAEGSKPPYRWSMVADPNTTLPNLALSTAGVLSGTPAQTGTYEFTVRVSATDEDGETTVSQRCAITVDPPPITFTSNSVLPSTVAGERYQAQLRAAGAPGTVRYELYNSALAPGLTLNSNGTVSGSALLDGNYQFLVRASADASVASVKRFTLNVTPRELTVTSSCPLPNGTGGVAYGHQFAARGGVPPYRWSLGAGPSLPTGLLLTADGRLSGLPTVPHWWPFNVKVEDSAGNSRELGCGVVILFPELSLTNACPLPGATAGISYSQRLDARGGTAPYSFSIDGNLPAGLRLGPDGTISGNPLVAGPSQFRVRVTDRRGQSAASACSLAVERGTYGIATCPLADAYAGEPYAQTVSATGGLEPYRFNEAAPLPSGLRISPDGYLSGVLDRAGTYPVALRVTDQTGQTSTRSCTLTVRPQALRVTNVCPLPAATLGQAYRFEFSVAGGVMPYEFESTQLPAGLRLVNGAIAGTPAEAGVQPMLFRVRDRSGQATIFECGIVVELPELPAIRVTGLPATLAPAVAGPRFSVELGQNYPLAVEGVVNLSVVADTGVPTPGANRPDPLVKLANGQLSAPFRIEAGSRSASFQINSTGTVASVITATADKLTVAGIETGRQASGQTRLGRSIPVITNVCYAPTSEGFDVEVAGYSTTRELTSAELTFGANTFQVNLTEAAGEYFGSDDSVRTGGTFRFRAPYRVSQATTAGLAQGNAVIRNTVGASPSRTIARCN
ncbi:MAG: putative Ig domain-containing protein [Bryobacterales bacterium]|nr:putative Ig domain-containing protein [Bryobacterales bacterium]